MKWFFKKLFIDFQRQLFYINALVLRLVRRVFPGRGKIHCSSSMCL